MAITQNDLEILKSEIMADTDDGGGLPTGIPVVDGVSNNLFPDVSDIDRLIGRVRLRKVSLAVKTANAELLQAARLLFTELPDNPNISVFAFKASSFADRRSDAQNKIESYLAMGARCAGHLLETQLEGQKVIQLSIGTIGTGDQLPKVGQPLVLVQNEGQVDEFYQYIRPSKVSSVNRFFQRTASESVIRTVVTIEFDEPLGRTFTGLSVPEFYQNASTTRRAILREARVSDSAKYYSASRLAEPVMAMTSRQVKIKSIYTQVVPASITETALPLLSPSGESKTLVRASDGTVTVNKTVSVSQATPWQIGSSIYPSTLLLTISGIVMSDIDGELKSGSTAYASVNYDAGSINWYSNTNFGLVTVTGGYTPAAALMRVMQSEVQYTPTINVGTSYLRDLQANPTKGSLRISFQVGEQVVIARDDSKGNLVSSNSTDKYGIVDYDNKLVQLILPAIPNPESAIIYSYATDLGTSNSGGEVTKGYFDFELSYYMPRDFTLSWATGKTATVTNGVITGDATGSINGSKLQLIPNDLPPVGTVFTASYSKPTNVLEVKRGAQNFVSRGNNSTITDFDIGAFDADSLLADIKVNGRWVATGIDIPMPVLSVAVRDDVSNGGLISLNTKSRVVANSPVKSIQVSIASSSVDRLNGTGFVNFLITGFIETVEKVITNSTSSIFNGALKKVEYVTKLTPVTGVVDSIDINYQATYNKSATTTTTSTYTASNIRVDLPNDYSAPIVIGSVSVLGATDSASVMMRDGAPVGSIDYQSGGVTLTNWQTGVNNITIDSAVREYLVPPVGSLVFRTQSAPIKQGTLSLNARYDDEARTYSTDPDTNFILASDGKTNPLPLRGFVDHQNGVVAIYAEGKLEPESVNYTAVAYSYLPLDKELIGLDPVRLPTDGRVPFVQKGDSIAITELKTMVLPTNAANDSFDLGFERLSDVNVVDSTGKKVRFDYLDVDLDAGILTLNDTYLPSEYTAPLTAKYRIMDIALVLETDISGRVTLSTPITHDYSTAAVFSSMLLAGDMQARAFNVFSQQSWGSIFSDTLIGNAAISQLQVTNNPIVVTNRDAITERWALVFTSATAFKIIGETVGEIGTGSTLETTAPINPMTGYPYFTIPLQAWGVGWAANNVVRINTDSAKYPVWIGNAIQQHQGSSTDNYDFTIGYHANIDRERGAP